MEQNVSYYNEIAAQYDELLDRDSLNGDIRDKVASYFNGLVPPGLVLDFGGGTGKDLGWLMASGHRVIHCEPSPNMREKAVIRAIKDFPGSPLRFLENEASDFTTWSTGLPFPEKVDAVLANFAVINSIPDVTLLFNNLSLVIKPGGHVLILALQAGFAKRWRYNRLATLLSLITQQTVTGHTRFKQQQQQVYIHTIQKIKTASGACFHFRNSTAIDESNFILIQLTRQ